MPERLANKPHTHGEFVVRFLGSNDHSWVSKGRTYKYDKNDEKRHARLKHQQQPQTGTSLKSSFHRGMYKLRSVAVPFCQLLSMCAQV